MIEGKSLGEYINFKRNELGYGLREFAKEIGISHAYLSQIETSKKIPTKKKIKLIAIGLNVPEELLLAEAFNLPLKIPTNASVSISSATITMSQPIYKKIIKDGQIMYVEMSPEEVMKNITFSFR